MSSVAAAAAAQQQPVTMLPVPPLPPIGLPLPHIGLPPPTADAGAPPDARRPGAGQPPRAHRRRPPIAVVPVYLTPIFLVTPPVPAADAPAAARQPGDAAVSASDRMEPPLTPVDAAPPPAEVEPGAEPKPGPEPEPRPSGPTTLYVIEGCYAGNVPPTAVTLPAGCDAARVTTIAR